MMWNKLFLWRLGETLGTGDVLLVWHRQTVGADDVSLAQQSVEAEGLISCS